MPGVQTGQLSCSGADRSIAVPQLQDGHPLLLPTGPIFRPHMLPLLQQTVHYWKMSFRCCLEGSSSAVVRWLGVHVDTHRQESIHDSIATIASCILQPRHMPVVPCMVDGSSVQGKRAVSSSPE